MRARTAITAVVAAILVLLGMQPALAGNTTVFNDSVYAARIVEDGRTYQLNAWASSYGSLRLADVDTINLFIGMCGQIQVDYGAWRLMAASTGIPATAKVVHFKQFVC